jgi:hypothetical protein
MPRILVTTDGPDGREATLALHERVAPGELESDGVCARLVERLGWALVDADEIEHGTPPPQQARREWPMRSERIEARALRAA